MGGQPFPLPEKTRNNSIEMDWTMGKSHGVVTSPWQKPKKYKGENPWPANPTIGREKRAVNCSLTRESGLRGGNSGPSFRLFSSEGKIFLNLWFRKAESQV